MSIRNLISIGFLFCCSILLKAQTKPWSFKECIDTAWKNNITLRQNQFSNETNKINLEQSKENLLPNLNASDAPAFNLGKTLNATTGSYINQSTTSNSFAITSSVTLFNGFQYLNTIRQNKFIYDAGVQQVEKVKNDLLLNVLAGYMQVLMAYEVVDIANSQLAIDSSQIIQVQKYIDAGKVPESNMLQILSQLASDKLSKVTAENQLQLAKVTLMQFMNIPVVNGFEIVRPESTAKSLAVTPTTSEDIFKTASAFLPEIKNAALNVNANEIGLKVSKSLYMPKLTLSGSVRTSGSSLAYEQNYQQESIGYLQSNPADQVIGFVPVTTMNSDFSNLQNQMNNNFNEFIGFNLSIPIYNNSQARNQEAIAKINIANAKLNQESVEIQLRKNIEQAYTDLLAASSQYAASQEALKYESLTYQNLEKKFRIGLSSATDYLIEKSNLLKAEQNVSQAKYDYLFKQNLIDFYLGNPITLQ